MACTHKSGKTGTLTIDAAEPQGISNWQMDITANTGEMATNATGGFKGRTSGVKDTSGAFIYVVPDTATTMPVVAGDCVALILDIDGLGTNTYEQNVVISDTSLTTDINDGGLFEYNVSFNGDGALTYNGALAGTP